MTELHAREHTRRSAVRLSVAVLGAAVVSVLVVLVSALFGHATVGERADQRDVALGWPIAWIHQDQTLLDPPFPWQAGFASPWEHPTTVSGGAFVGDVLIVLAAAVALLGLLVVVRRLRAA